MSTFEIKVVPVVLEPHPNADSLSIVHIRGYQVIVRTEDWKGEKEGIYIPPDSLVPNTEPFKFLFSPDDPLDFKYRIRVKKLRGHVSMGLLIKIPEYFYSDILLELDYINAVNLAEHLNITHYDPPIELNTSGETAKPPQLYLPIYDIENWYNYLDIFEEGENICVTEKIHGAQGRWVFHEGQFYCGSKREWKKETNNNIWWIVLKQDENLQNFLRKYPDTVAYGEVYGDVQDLKYGFSKGKVGIRLFDIFNFNHSCKFSNVEEFENFIYAFCLWSVPKLQIFKYSKDNLVAEGNSDILKACHIREGIVIKPMIERTHSKIGRVILKKVSNDYLERIK